MWACGLLEKWIFSCWTSRKHVILPNGESRTVSEVNNQVSQGTVLGPLLFLILIKDLGDDVFNSFISLFVEDTRITQVIQKDEDIDDFQKEIKLAIYMKFNTTKLEVLKHGKDFF